MRNTVLMPADAFAASSASATLPKAATARWGKAMPIPAPATSRVTNQQRHGEGRGLFGLQQSVGEEPGSEHSRPAHHQDADGGSPLGVRAEHLGDRPAERECGSQEPGEQWGEVPELLPEERDERFGPDPERQHTNGEIDAT